MPSDRRNSPKRLIIQNGRVIDPAHGVDRVTNVLIADGRIAVIGRPGEVGAAARTIDGMNSAAISSRSPIPA